VEDNHWDINRAREPRMGNVMGYEPGTKSILHKGFSDETFEVWKSELPNIDIKHRHTFSSSKYALSDFEGKADNWRKEKLENIPYWNLRGLHDLWIAKYKHQLTQW